MKSKYIITLASLLLSCSAFCQINWSDSTAQAITYWNLHDSFTYEVQLEKLKIVNGDTVSNEIITYDVDISVIDSTHNSYVIEWFYNNFKIEGANPITEKIMRISENIGVEILTDELGVLQKVVNWEEIRDYTNGIVDSLLLGLPANAEITNMINNLKGMYASELGVTNAAIQDIHQYHTFFGGAYKLNELLEGELAVPNLYAPGESLNAAFTVALTDLNADDNTYFLEYYHSVDEAQLKAATYRFLEQMNMPKEVLDEMENIELSNNVESWSEIHNTGWVIASQQIKDTIAEESRDLEIRTIVMK